MEKEQAERLVVALEKIAVAMETQVLILQAAVLPEDETEPKSNVIMTQDGPVEFRS